MARRSEGLLWVQIAGRIVVRVRVGTAGRSEGQVWV